MKSELLIDRPRMHRGYACNTSVRRAARRRIARRFAPSRVCPSPSARTARRPPSARLAPLRRGDSSSPIACGSHDRHAARPHSTYPSRHSRPVTSDAHGSPAFRAAPPYCPHNLLWQAETSNYGGVEPAHTVIRHGEKRFLSDSKCFLDAWGKDGSEAQNVNVNVLLAEIHAGVPRCGPPPTSTCQWSGGSRPSSRPREGLNRY